MASSFEPADYSTILFMDAMVALEGKPLADQRWRDIDRTGPILILVVPQVMREIDKRKRDGRLAKRARAFNRLIGPAAQSASTVRISDGPPIVDIGLAICDRVDWDALDDLDPEEPDARVVAQVLYARGVPAERRLLFSHDINPIAMASRHGLKTMKMPESWLLEPEPSPHEKEVNKLKARVQELEADEPDMQASVAFGVDDTLTIYKVAPLSATDQAEATDRILAKNPKIAQRTSTILGPHMYDTEYDQKYEEFRQRRVPAYAADVHRYLEAHYAQVPFELTIENLGHVQAENLVVSLRAKAGRLHDRFVHFPIFGPVAPRPQPYRIMPPALRFDPRDIVQQPGRHDVAFGIGPDAGDTIELHCADFRHGRVWTFEGIAWLDPHAESPFIIEVDITASNMRGARAIEFALSYESRSVQPSDLVDFGERKHLIEIPLEAAYDDAVKKQRWDWFEYRDSLEEDADEDDEDLDEADQHLG